MFFSVTDSGYTYGDKSLLKLSVIIPVYNAGKYIRNTIEAVFSQTLNDIEVICIDDGSTDNSVEEINDIIHQGYNVRLYSQKNSGAGAARNYGICEARGEYVSFLDADDEYADNRALENAYNLAKEEKSYVAGGQMIIYSNNHRSGYVPKLYYPVRGRHSVIIDYKDDFQYDYNFYAFIYQTSFLRQNNCSFPEIRKYEDPPFMARALYKANRIAIADFEFYRYNYVNKQSSFSSNDCLDNIAGIEMNLRFAFEHDLDRLWKYNLNRLNYDFREMIIAHLMLKDDDLPVVKKILSIQSLVTQKDTDMIIYPIMERLSGDKEEFFDYMISKRMKKCISKGSKVFMYGAGEYGDMIYRYNGRSGYFDCRGVIDSNKCGDRWNDTEICGTDALLVSDYDYVLITLMNDIYAYQVMSRLNDMGIPGDKIRFFSESMEILCQSDRV